MGKELVDQLTVRAASLDAVTVASQHNMLPHRPLPQDACAESGTSEHPGAGPQEPRACRPDEGRLTGIFFGIITRQAIRRGTFRNVKDLTNAIGRFIDAYNQRCQPFTWTKDADQLIAKIRPSKN